MKEKIPMLRDLSKAQETRILLSSNVRQTLPAAFAGRAIAVGDVLLELMRRERKWRTPKLIPFDDGVVPRWPDCGQPSQLSAEHDAMILRELEWDTQVLRGRGWNLSKSQWARLEKLAWLSSNP